MKTILSGPSLSLKTVKHHDFEQHTKEFKDVISVWISAVITHTHNAFRIGQMLIDFVQLKLHWSFNNDQLRNTLAEYCVYNAKK